MRVFYRARQFWLALRAQPTAQDLGQARGFVSAPLMALFNNLQPGEQAHGLHVLRKLLQQGETHPDLLAAALLHDVGKQRCALLLWERAMIVMARALCHEKAKRWGSGSAEWDLKRATWRRPFIVAEQHPAWGAELARQAGASDLLVSLILRHQQPLSPSLHSLEDELLSKLQVLDDES